MDIVGIVMIKVSSTSNDRYKYVKSLLKKKARMLNKEYTVEGIKSVKDAIAANQNISLIAVSESFYEDTCFSYPEDIELIVVSDAIFESLCDTQTPQGIIAVIKMCADNDFCLTDDSICVYCDDVRDPGNIGTIIRTAEAAGFDSVMLSPECVDVYSPKVVRASMGSYFNIDIITDVTKEKLKEFKTMGARLIGGALRENTYDYRDIDYSSPAIIVVGNEANGISEPVLDMCTCVKIPIYGKAESLNVSVAAGILMYEAVRNKS